MFGMAAGPLVGGFIYDRTGAYTLAFVLMVLMFTACAALVLYLREPALADPPEL